MTKKILRLAVLILIILIPNIAFAKDMDSIIIVVDELSIKAVEELSLDKYSLGFINLKTRPPYSEEGLYLSINTGRKLTLRDLGKNDLKIDYLGDILTNEKVSYIGMGKGSLLIGNKERAVDHSIDTIEYNYDWLVENTDNIFDKSKIMVLEYEIQNESSRVKVLERYLNHYKDKQIILLPKKVAKEDQYILNTYLVPIIYTNGINNGILTSPSTKREGFIALEDISAQIKSTYGYGKKVDIGKPFQFINMNSPVEEFKDIYNKNINLFFIAYFFHGLTYFIQVLLGFWMLKKKKIETWIYDAYNFVSMNILVSLLLGLFEFHKNIILYLIINLSISYLLTRIIKKRKIDSVKFISTITYGLIVLGTILYSKAIYNSYIGFNNLIYGARYYGLNNGIMGVLLSTSILSFFSITKSMENKNLKRIVGLFIFTMNMLTLSTYFGANTGGFITSVVLFGIVICGLFFSNKGQIKTLLLFVLLGIAIFSINIFFDNITGENTHALGFFYRLKVNGLSELISVASFKAKELFKLTIVPPFSIVLIFQGIILSKLRKKILNNEELKKEAMILLITSSVGFILNDTGIITLIYMVHYLILDIITRQLETQ